VTFGDLWWPLWLFKFQILVRHLISYKCTCWYVVTFGDLTWPTFGHRSSRSSFNFEGSLVKEIWTFDLVWPFKCQIWIDYKISRKWHLLTFGDPRWPLVTPSDLLSDIGQDFQVSTRRSIVSDIWPFKDLTLTNGQFDLIQSWKTFITDLRRVHTYHVSEHEGDRLSGSFRKWTKISVMKIK
jgi:hypothetical protein